MSKLMIESGKTQFDQTDYQQNLVRLLAANKWNQTENSYNINLRWNSTDPSPYDEGATPVLWDVLMRSKIVRADYLELIGRYENLKSNWDGYDALPPFPAIIEKAKNLIQALPDESVLPIDDIFPNSNGTVTFEWLNSNKKCALEIGLSNYSCFLDMQNTDPVYLSGKDILVDIKDFTEKLEQFLG